MARQISANFLDKLNSTRKEKLVTVVKVFWSDGAIQYSENEILWDIGNGVYTMPCLMEVGQIDIANRLNNDGTSVSFDVTLDDSDGHINERNNREIVNGIRCEAYLQFEGLDSFDALLLATGIINSDSIKWDEANRLFSFGVENTIVSKSVSYQGYDGMNNPSAIPLDTFTGKYFPFVFGAPRQTPTLKYQQVPFAISSTRRNYNGVTGNGIKAHILNEPRGFPIDQDVTLQFCRPSDLDDLSGGGVLGRVFEYNEDQKIFIPAGVNPEITPVPVLTSRNILSPFFDNFRYWWIDIDPGVTNLEDNWLDFADNDGHPSLFAYKIIEHIVDPTDAAKFRIRLSHQPRWGVDKEERKVVSQFDQRNWMSEFVISNVDGTIQSNISIAHMAENPRFAWIVRTFKYTAVGLNNQQSKEDINTLSTSTTILKEYNKMESGSVKASLTVRAPVIDPTNPNISTYVTDFIPEGEDSYNVSKRNYTWTTYDASGFADGIPIDFPPDTDVIFVIVKLGSGTVRYVANIFTSQLNEAGSQDIVAIGTTSDGRLIDVPKGDITTYQIALVPNEEIKQTIISMNPLEYNKYSHATGEIYANVETAYHVFDGRGGVIDVDTSNAVEVIKWLFDVFTELTVTNGGDNFITLRERVSNKKMAFCINEDFDAIETAKTIAWEHKLGLVFFGDSVSIIDLSAEPFIEQTFDTSNIELQSFSKGFIPTTNIITDFKLAYKERKNEEGDILVFQNNVRRYGKHTQSIEILTHDSKEAVLDLLKFWGNRMSRAWRTVAFKAKIDALKLLPYDAVEINVPILSRNVLIGFVDSIRYVPNTFDVELTLILASEASNTLSDSQPIVDVTFWQGIKNLTITTGLGVAIASKLDGAFLRKFTEQEFSSLRRFERRL